MQMHSLIKFYFNIFVLFSFEIYLNVMNNIDIHGRWFMCSITDVALWTPFHDPWYLNYLLSSMDESRDQSEFCILRTKIRFRTLHADHTIFSFMCAEYVIQAVNCQCFIQQQSSCRLSHIGSLRLDFLRLSDKELQNSAYFYHICLSLRMQQLENRWKYFPLILRLGVCMYRQVKILVDFGKKYEYFKWKSNVTFCVCLIGK